MTSLPLRLTDELQPVGINTHLLKQALGLSKYHRNANEARARAIFTAMNNTVQPFLLSKVVSEPAFSHISRNPSVEILYSRLFVSCVCVCVCVCTCVRA